MSALVSSLDDLSAWRRTLQRGCAELARWLADQELLSSEALEPLHALGQRLCEDRLRLAVVAEVSRGKSELINAMFFADSGRRVMPATLGRTTMCPVELAFDAQAPRELRLLPIDTRLGPRTLAELREQPEAWRRIALPAEDNERLAQALSQVTATQRVSPERARELGLWSEDSPRDNPPLDAEGLVEVPAWRHALINTPHPLLQRGLVVLDTPGLNAVGTEPELTLSLLPSAQATLFLLAADAGVTKTDLAIWRDHLGGNALERFVVLNKIDALADPLLSREQVAQQIERQREACARALNLPVSRVFPLSARQALAARIQGDEAALAASRVPELEAALSAELLPRQRERLSQGVRAVLAQVRAQAGAHLAERRRHVAEQLIELQAVHGKSAPKLALMRKRLETEAQEFEACSQRLLTVRGAHAREFGEVMRAMGGEALREPAQRFVEATKGGGLHLNARAALAEFGVVLDAALQGAHARASNLALLQAAQARELNTAYGMRLQAQAVPALGPWRDELATVLRRHAGHLSPLRLWRLAGERQMGLFQRNLLAQVRALFEAATNDFERWAMGFGSRLDDQIRDRRATFERRREGLGRAGQAGGELDQRIAELREEERVLAERSQRLEDELAGLDALARAETGSPAAAAASAARAAA